MKQFLQAKILIGIREGNCILTGDVLVEGDSSRLEVVGCGAGCHEGG